MQQSSAFVSEALTVQEISERKTMLFKGTAFIIKKKAIRILSLTNINLGGLSQHKKNVVPLFIINCDVVKKLSYIMVLCTRTKT